MKKSTLELTLTDRLSNHIPFDSSSEVIYLDPVALYQWIDWTEFEEQVEVLNKIYSLLFDEVIINHKKIKCFWPLGDNTSQHWFEILTLCKERNVFLTKESSGISKGADYGLDARLVEAWQDLMVTVLGSLVEDLSLNQQFEEIGTLSSATHSFILFRSEMEGIVRFGYSEVNTFTAYADSLENPLELSSYIPCFYDSFQELIGAVADLEDLSELVPVFYDKGLEKQFFQVLLSENKPVNLIQKWQLSYSLN